MLTSLAQMSFFPKNDEDADRKNFNVKSGTTIDTDITSPLQFDWYTQVSSSPPRILPAPTRLTPGWPSQSHASLLGTGRSAHYTVLVDDSKFSADVLQQLVFNLYVSILEAHFPPFVTAVLPAAACKVLATAADIPLKADSLYPQHLRPLHSFGLVRDPRRTDRKSVV